jgi:hypothetical protein
VVVSDLAILRYSKLVLCGTKSILTLIVANPFARRESHPVQAILTYKVLTIVTWFVNATASIYYTFGIPDDDKKGWRNSIWGHNSTFPTPFALNSIITSIYWYAK